jgi:hypothetical protein
VNADALNRPMEWGIRRMIAIGLLFARMLRDFFKPRLRLEAEILR